MWWISRTEDPHFVCPCQCVLSPFSKGRDRYRYGFTDSQRRAAYLGTFGSACCSRKAACWMSVQEHGMTLKQRGQEAASSAQYRITDATATLERLLRVSRQDYVRQVFRAGHRCGPGWRMGAPLRVVDASGPADNSGSTGNHGCQPVRGRFCGSTDAVALGDALFTCRLRRRV